MSSKSDAPPAYSDDVDFHSAHATTAQVFQNGRKTTAATAGNYRFIIGQKTAQSRQTAGRERRAATTTGQHTDEIAEIHVFDGAAPFSIIDQSFHVFERFVVLYQGFDKCLREFVGTAQISHHFQIAVGVFECDETDKSDGVAPVAHTFGRSPEIFFPVIHANIFMLKSIAFFSWAEFGFGSFFFG